MASIAVARMSCDLAPKPPLRNAANVGAASTTAAPVHNVAVTSRVLLRVVLAVACAAGAVVSFTAYVSQRRLYDAGAEFQRTLDFHVSLRDLRASESPLNPSQVRDAAQAVGLLHTGRPAAAERILARSARDHPYDAETWVALARLQLARRRV